MKISWQKKRFFIQ